MARNVTIRDIDMGWDEIRYNLAHLHGHGTDVGIFPEAGAYPDGTPVVNVAAWNEFGTDTNPERPFMRTTMEENHGKFARHAERLLRELLRRRMTVDAVLTTLGAIQATAVKKTINDWTTPPNSPRTIAIKGRNDPLVDTRLMRDSVKFKKY